MVLQGILFFDRMTEEVLDSIRPGLQVSKHAKTNLFSTNLEKDSLFLL
jgi:hypothetical protein